MPSSATAPTPAALTAPAASAPAPELIQAEIANTFDLEAKLKYTAADLKNKRETGEAAFVAALAKEVSIASVPLNIDTSKAFRDWKAADGALEAKAKATDEALAAVQRQLDRLKDAQPDAIRDLLERRKAALKEDLEEVEKRLGELGGGSKAKSTK